METTTKSGSSFWSKKEGKFGLGFILALVALGGVLLWKFGALLLGLLTNAIGIAIAGVVLFALLYVVFSKEFRTNMWYIFKWLMRKMAGLVYNLDPIATVKIYIQYLKDNLVNMEVQIRKLKGQMEYLNEMITKNKREVENSFKIMKQAQKVGNKGELYLRSRKAGRLNQSNIQLGDLYTKMAKLYKVLVKMYEASGYIVADMEDEVQVTEQRYKALETGYNAMRSGMQALVGDENKRAIYEAAMGKIEESCASRVGEMERFMEMSKTFIDGVDLQNMMYEEDALTMLDEWEKNGYDSMMKMFEGGDNWKNTGVDVSTLTKDISTPQVQPVENHATNNSSKYGGLFN